MSETEMTVSRWASNEIEFIKKFEDWWADRRAENPDDFPEEMGAGDWVEQFNIYCATEAGL